MLYLGVARRDITPTVPGFLSGFAHRTAPWQSIHSRLALRVFAFQGEHSTTAPAPRAAVVVADLIGWDFAETTHLEARLRKALGIDLVIFSATHTHSAPCVGSSGHPIFSARDEAYVDHLYQSVAEALGEAYNHLEAVTLHSATGSSGNLFINRRRPTPDGIKAEPYPNGPADDTITLWRFDRVTENSKYSKYSSPPKALWIHAACHPTLLSGNAVSSEFPGEVLRRLEQADPSVSCAFLQGCCGDIRANVTDSHGRFKISGEADLATFSDTLFRCVRSILDSPDAMTPLGNGALSSFSSVFEQPLQPGEASPQSVPIRISGLRLTDRAGVIALPGEPSLHYQQIIKAFASSGLSLLPLGYCNGMPGYLPTATQIQEGGYEGFDSCRFFDLPRPFCPSLEEQLREGIFHIVEQLFSPVAVH